jgi:multicomponent Na+:H+ antiporter subunit D
MQIAPNPGFVLLLGAGLACILPHALRVAAMVGAAMAAIVLMFTPDFGDQTALADVGLTFTPLRLDSLSQIFGLSLAVIAGTLGLFSISRRDRLEDVALAAHLGGAVTASFAGDLVSFIAAVQFSMLAGAALALNGRGALAARMRPFLWHGGAGIVMTAGAGLIWAHGRNIDFDHLDARTPGGALILLGLLIMAGAPLAHAWVRDALARARPVAGAALAATPAAVATYALARAFPGEPALLWVGVAMALWPLPFAAVARDLRQAIGYGVVSQTGLALAALGVGTPLAVAGATAFAFVCAPQNALSFLAIGLAYERAEAAGGRVGGLARSMPITALMAIAAALSALAVPAFAGFAARTVALHAIVQEGRNTIWLALTAAGAGAVLHIGLRAPYEVFFGRDQGARPPEAPFGSQLAMGLLGYLCVAVGVAPSWLYGLLSDQVYFHPYDGAGARAQLELAASAALAFGLAKRLRVYPTAEAAEVPDLDWALRRPARALSRGAVFLAAGADRFLEASVRRVWPWGAALAARSLAAFDRPSLQLIGPGVWALLTTAGTLGFFYLFQR